jgi:hypothetical protein
MQLMPKQVGRNIIVIIVATMETLKIAATK